MIEFPSAAADRAVLAALEEDAAACDLTTQWSVPDGLVSEATIISRAHGIIAGLQLVDLVMHHIDPNVDAERNKLAQDLLATQRVAKLRILPGTAVAASLNGGGDFYRSDGKILVPVLK